VLSCGIRPRALLGAGLGELAAACVAGVFTVGDAAEALLRGGSPVGPKTPGIPVYPSHGSTPLDDATATDAAYWRDRVTQVVEPSRAALAALGPAVCLDIGTAGQPSPTGPGDGERTVLLATRGIDAPDDHMDDHAALLDAIAALWRLGFGGGWEPVHDRGRRRVPLPTYPFATTRHVIENR
jgi:acyl transferase domain-containing protein